MSELTMGYMIDTETTTRIKRANKEDLKMKLINMGIHIGSYKINFSINRSYEAMIKRLEKYYALRHAIKEKDEKLTEYGMFNFIV